MSTDTLTDKVEPLNRIFLAVEGDGHPESHVTVMQHARQMLCRAFYGSEKPPAGAADEEAHRWGLFCDLDNWTLNAEGTGPFGFCLHDGDSRITAFVVTGEGR